MIISISQNLYFTLVCGDSWTQIFRDLTEEQNTVSQPVSRHVLNGWRFSLRRVFLRLCKDANYFPKFLLLKGIAIAANKLPAGVGSNGDVYQIPSPLPEFPGSLALKRFRFMAKNLEAKRHTATVSILVYLLIMSIPLSRSPVLILPYKSLEFPIRGFPMVVLEKRQHTRILWSAYPDIRRYRGTVCCFSLDGQREHQYLPDKPQGGSKYSSHTLGKLSFQTEVEF